MADDTKKTKLQSCVAISIAVALDQLPGFRFGSKADVRERSARVRSVPRTDIDTSEGPLPRHAAQLVRGPLGAIIGHSRGGRMAEYLPSMMHTRNMLRCAKCHSVNPSDGLEFLSSSRWS